MMIEWICVVVFFSSSSVLCYVSVISYYHITFFFVVVVVDERCRTYVSPGYMRTLHLPHVAYTYGTDIYVFF